MLLLKDGLDGLVSVLGTAVFGEDKAAGIMGGYAMDCLVETAVQDEVVEVLHLCFKGGILVGCGAHFGFVTAIVDEGNVVS